MSRTKTASLRCTLFVIASGLSFHAHLSAQGRPQAAAPADAAKAAPFDPAGYWVSFITKNWRMTMVTPAKGDYQGIPLNDAAKKVADTWDPRKDEATGNACKSYGAGMIMSIPGRLHIAWADPNTLRMDIDNGNQTRTFHFGNWSPADHRPTLQGESTASWVARKGQDQRASTPKAKYLLVTTSHMLPGYLRKNGVPYSDQARLTEYYDLIHEQDGSEVLLVTTVLEDPVYLDNPYILSSQYKKEADASGWDPTPCSSVW